MTTRGPAEPGLSTSTTQPSITVGSCFAGAIGAEIVAVLSLAIARPRAKQASSINGRFTTRPAPSRRAACQPSPVTAASATKGHSGGSDFSAR